MEPSPRQKVQVWIYSKNPEGSRGEVQFLLLKTNEARGGYWQPVTGHVEPNEKLIDAARREVQEETGLSLKDLPLAILYVAHFEKNGVEFAEYGFSYDLKSTESVEKIPIQIDQKEHVEYQWVSFKKAMSLLKFRSNSQMLATLLKQMSATF